jgi:hypothetical protein
MIMRRILMVLTTMSLPGHSDCWRSGRDAPGSAPLMAANVIANRDGRFKGFLVNKEVIAIDRDPLGSIADGNGALVLFKPSFQPAGIGVTWTAISHPLE